MERKFHIVNDYNEVIATLYTNKEEHSARMVLLDDYTGLHPSMFFLIAWETGRKVIDENMTMSYLEHRVFPPNRHALSDHLKNLGLKEYNIFDILDKTHGICGMDHDRFVEIK